MLRSMTNQFFTLSDPRIKNILRPFSEKEMQSFSKKELMTLLSGEQSIRYQMAKIIEEAKIVETKRIELEGKFVVLRSKIFSPSSEKTKDDAPKEKKENKEKKKRSRQIKNLEERYPNLPKREDIYELEKIPTCPCCSTEMENSGLTENSQYLEIIPRKYILILQKRAKYRCTHCYGHIETAPAPARIVPKSSYGDQFILNAALSKFCDLLPVERQVAMASRSGLKNLPANSIIQVIHQLAAFVAPVIARNLEEIKKDIVIHADETPHRMLEEHAGKSWYLWGISSSNGCHFQIENTRSGLIAAELLKTSCCEFLMSDVFSGYSSAVKEINIFRKENNAPEIRNIYCNAHARRKFKDMEKISSIEAEIFIKNYKIIYELESNVKNTNDYDEKIKYRESMRPYFETMKKISEKNLQGVSERSVQATAYKYFLKNYEFLIFFITDIRLPIDNNVQESLLRNPVIGRKTWYGTHSIKGAKTTTILFSLIESCKLLKINPREYFDFLIKEIHQSKNYITPYEFKNRKNNP